MSDEPPKPRRMVSCAESYREACEAQAAVMRSLAGQLRREIDRLTPHAVFGAGPHMATSKEVASTIVAVACVESALLSIAKGLTEPQP
jgi:hypothetical protein